MKTDNSIRSARVSFLAMGVSLMALMLMLFVIEALSAEGLQNVAPDLGGSSKQVSHQNIEPGGQAQYTVSLINSGDTLASGIKVTDTLPVSLTYVASSVSVSPTTGTTSDSDNTIRWEGDIDSGGVVEITYAAILTDVVSIGTMVTNTAEIAFNGAIIERSASITAFTYSDLYLPLIYKPLLAPILHPISGVDASNNWMISWDLQDGAGPVNGFELQEAQDPGFSNPTSFFFDSAARSTDHPGTPSFNNEYYYRIRSLGQNSDSTWSEIRSVIGAYLDNFNDSSSNWAIRRQDTDDVFNELFYTDGHLKHRVHGRWDYMIASPMKEVPEPPYRIEARVRIDQPDNLHAYGIIFGGDWDGRNCPYDPANEDYSSCFTQYYRLLSVWFGSPDKLLTSLKRIDYHDPNSNAGRGVDLLGFTDVTVNSPTETYQTWAVEVYPAGYRTDGVTIRILVNGNLVGQSYDTSFLTQPYFGTFTADDEYGGLDVRYDWYKVSPIE